MRSVFLNYRPCTIKQCQGLQQPFVFEEEVIELTTEELTLAIKLWSKRITTLNNSIAKIEDYEFDKKDFLMKEFESEKSLILESFDNAIRQSILRLNENNNPSVELLKMIELSQALKNSNLLQYPYTNLMIPTLLKLSKGADKIDFEKQRDNEKLEELKLYIESLNCDDHLGLSNAGVALYFLENADFEALFNAFLRELDILQEDPETIEEECKLITVHAEQLKMYKISDISTEQQKLAANYIVELYSQIKNRENVYVFLFADDINYNYNKRGEFLDVFHETVWSAVSFLIKLVAGNIDFYDECVLPTYHKDTLENLECQIIEILKQRPVDEILAFGYSVIEKLGSKLIPIERRAGCIPYIFASIFLVLSEKGKQAEMKQLKKKLWSCDSLCSKWALFPYYREKLTYGSKYMIDREEYVECMVECIDYITSEYLVRNVYFSLFSVSSESYLCRNQLRYSKLREEEREIIMRALINGSECEIMLALLFLSFCENESNLELCECILQVGINSNSITLEKARAVARFSKIEDYLATKCTYFDAVVVRTQTRGEFHYEFGRGHCLFEESTPDIDEQEKQKINEWLEELECSNLEQRHFIDSFMEEIK